MKNYCFSDTFPKVPENGQLKLENGGDPFTKENFEVDEKVYFTCKNGGNPEEDLFTACQQNGFFSEANFKCPDGDS